jgi:hypothetical protein
MFFDSASWRDIGTRFRALVDPTGDLHAIPENERQNRWDLSGGPDNDRDRGCFTSSFGIWLEKPELQRACRIVRTRSMAGSICLRDESPYYKRMGKGAVIWALCQASAEQCENLAIRARELEIAAQRDDHPGLRRDRYPVNGWLGDDQDEPLSDASEELNRRKSHAWRGYRNRLKNIARSSTTN